MPTIDLAKLSYREALHHGGPKLADDLIVIHTTANTPPSSKGAEAIQNYFADTIGDRVASAHATVDSDSIACSVRWTDMAWHAPGANHDGWGIEHYFAYQASAADWETPYAKAMLEQSADLTAALCKSANLPAVWCGVADLLADRRGFTTHALVSQAFRRSDHYDPGSGFPVGSYLQMVKHRLGKGHDPAPVSPWPSLYEGDGLAVDDPKRPWVRKLQVMLDQHPKIRLKPYGGAAQHDGIFGLQTRRAVVQFQTLAHIWATGQVGPPTWRALKLAVHFQGLTDDQRRAA